MNEDQVRKLLREMREETVPANSLARVRMNVAGRTRQSSRRRIAAWVTAFAALAVAGILMQSGALVQKAVRVSTAATKTEQALPLLPARDPWRPAVQRTRRHSRSGAPVQTVSIRIETPDPDVVIWLVGN